MTTKVIDIHPHVVSPDLERYPLDPLGGKRSTWSTSHNLTPDELIKAMDQAGVDKCALVHSSTTYGYDNSLVCDAVEAYPDRITGVCSIDVLAPDATEVLRAWLDRGCTGLRMFTTGSTMPGQAAWLNDEKTYPVWELAGQINLPICIQCKIDGFDMLRDMMTRFSDVRVILDHMAQPDLSTGVPYPNAQPVLDLAEFSQLTIKVTPAAFDLCRKGQATPETFLPKLVAAYGPKRIAWGSNYPASPGTLSEMVAEARAAFSFLSDADIGLIMGGNAEQLYPALATKEVVQ